MKSCEIEKKISKAQIDFAFFHQNNTVFAL